MLKKMTRYSDEAVERARRRNHTKWVEKARERHGNHFDYSFSSVDYKTQKAPPIRITCPTHGEFRVLPHDHLRFAGGGCKNCGLSYRGSAKQKTHAEHFKKFFRERLASRLEILSPYRGVKEKIAVRCLFHEEVSNVTPDRLLQGAIGCPICVTERSRDSLKLNLEDVVEEFSEKFPDHIVISNLRFKEGRSSIKIDCERHGPCWESKGYLTKSQFGCPKCGNETVGYAGYRLRRLVESGDFGRDTWIAVMEVEVFGIRTLKVGITTRSLKERYKWFLKTVFFSAKMREIDALLLENEIHREFHTQTDLRIMKTGMRDGKRWSGDTECYLFHNKQLIIEFIKLKLLKLEKEKPNYWKAIRDFERKNFNIQLVGREKDTRNLPREVICLDTSERFPSQSEAARAKGLSQGNIGMVLSGNRRTAGGCRWVYAADYDLGKVPSQSPPRTGANSVRARPVIRLDTLEEYPTSLAAHRATGISASHITTVCRGRRRTAGGVQWAYLKDYRQGIH